MLDCLKLKESWLCHMTALMVESVVRLEPYSDVCLYCACPALQVVMLYVSEDTSITRQMARAELAKLHNSRVMDAGAGELV